MTRNSRSILFTIGITCACILSFYLGMATDRALTKPVSPGQENAFVRLTRKAFPAKIKPTGDVANQLFLNPDFGKCRMILLGCNELVSFHPVALEHILAAAVRQVHVVALVNDTYQRDRVMEIMRARKISQDRVSFIQLPLDSMWVRDFGPFFVLKRDTGKVLLVDADYSPDEEKHRWRDDEFPIMLSRITQLERVSIPLRLEGGNILSNGDGLCVSTTSTLMRNASRYYDLQDVGALLRESFGFSKWTYLEPLEDEPTGHVDMFVTLLAEDLAVVGEIDSSIDAVNANRLDEWARNLSDTTTRYGRKIRVERIPVPPRRGEHWRSYNNVIMLNKMMLVPTYSDVAPAMQQEALDTYARLLPDWEIVEIPADTLVPYRGLLRCVSLNIPWYVPMEPPPSL